MSWVRLDDGFPDHPKVAAAGEDAAWLYVVGLAYCARLLTDGFIPAAQVGRLTARRPLGRLVERLVAVGLWEPADGGYAVHDYLDYQPTAAAVRAARALGAERQARWRDAHPDRGRNGQPNAVTPAVTPPVMHAVHNGGRNGPVTPAPIPGNVPSPSPPPSPTRAAAAGGTQGGAAAPPSDPSPARARARPSDDDDGGWSLADAMDPATVDAARAAWLPICERLRAEMHPLNHALYIARCVPLGIADGALVLSTSNPLVLEQAAQFRGHMLRALAEVPDAPSDVRLVPSHSGTRA